LARVEGASIDGRLNVLRIRQRLFQSLHATLVQHHNDAIQAIQIDEGCSLEEALLVYGSSLIELRNHYDALDLRKDLEQEYRVAKGESNESRRTPFPITYIIPGTIHLFYNVISALSAALGAGSCVIVELENTTLRTSDLLRRIITASLDQDAFGSTSSRAPTEYLAKCAIVDQTTDLVASNISARRILSSSMHRNIALVDRTADVELAAREIVASRLAFKGTSLCAVDLVLVNEFVLDKFNAAAIQALEAIRGAEGTEKMSTSSDKSFASGRRSNSKLFNGNTPSDDVRWVNGNSNLGLLQLVNSAKLASSRVVVVHPTTSLDDPIDFLSTESQQSTPIAALYIFSGQREAKYLSQYIVSQSSYINHIPAQLMVGPSAPLDFPTNLRVRYTRDMFEVPSPQVVPGVRSHFASTIFKKANFIDAVARKPLKPTGQPPSGAWGFFEQGMVIGAFFYLLPI
ncbi:hypothetical protein BKA66DRAFT_388391, partial [Pyrenochaeta sp. MPI-SDFR-AT-0127]